MIDAYIELKMQDVQRMRMTTHPVSSTCTTRCNHCGGVAKNAGQACFPAFLLMLYIRDGCIHPRITNDNEFKLSVLLALAWRRSARPDLQCQPPGGSVNTPTSTAAAIASRWTCRA
jgi:hypothetical protein